MIIFQGRLTVSKSGTIQGYPAMMPPFVGFLQYIFYTKPNGIDRILLIRNLYLEVESKGIELF